MVSNPHGGKLTSIEQVDVSNPQIRKEMLEGLKVEVPYETKVTIFNISNGVFSPLSGFLNHQEYQSVLDDMRLTDDTPWTIPILLHIPQDFTARKGDLVSIVDESTGEPIALVECEEVYAISKKEFARKVFATEDEAHPGVAKIYSASERVLAGKISKAARFSNPTFDNFTLVPKETRVLFSEKGWRDIMAFQTRNAPHIGHEYVQKMALAFADGLFINPVLGRKKSGDFKDEVIVSSYQALTKNYYPKNSVVLSVLHYEMQYAGPKEAVMHAIMRKNFGCTHIAIGRDHAGVGNYYGPYAAHEIFKEFPDIGINAIFFTEFFYCNRCMGIANEKICPHSETDRLSFSGTKLRKMFQSGERPPREFMRPEVTDVILSSKSAFVE